MKIQNLIVFLTILKMNLKIKKKKELNRKLENKCIKFNKTNKKENLEN